MGPYEPNRTKQQMRMKNFVKEMEDFKKGEKTMTDEERKKEARRAEQIKLTWKKETWLEMSKIKDGKWETMTEEERDQTLEDLYTLKIALAEEEKTKCR